MDHLDFLKGAIAGGCIGGLVALLLTPRTGKDLRHAISEGYNSINSHSHEYADGMKREVKSLLNSMNSIEPETSHAFLIGGASGAIIGALAGLLMAPEAGNKLRSRLGDNYEGIYDKAKDLIDGVKNKKGNIEEKLEDWKDVFDTLVNKLSSHSSHPKSKKLNGDTLDSILDWATLGLRCYNQVKSRS